VNPSLLISSFCIGIMSLMVSVSNATECTVVEYPDRNDVVCVGDPVKQSLQPVNKPSVMHRAQYIEESKNDNSAKSRFIAKGIEVSGLVVIANQNEASFNVDFKCDVFTDSYESFVITIVGLNREGIEVCTVEIKGFVVIGRSSVITGSASMDAQKYFDSHTWEAKTVRTNSGTLNFVANRIETVNETTNRSSQATHDSSSTNSTVSDIIVMKRNVRFHHTNHQKNYSCYECHVQGKWIISGFGKKYAHGKGCKKCHEDAINGPTDCTGCHSNK